MGGISTSSRFSEIGEESVNVTSIDAIKQGELKEEVVTFIKMDIEGAELEALKGAKQTITRDKPDLAICIYHKDEDIVEIPKYILELNPRYELFLRHYDVTAYETILYAVMPRIEPYELSDIKWKILTRILEAPDEVMKAFTDIENPVIYGMGNLTAILVKEMKNRNIYPLCIIDRFKKSGCYEGIPVYNIAETESFQNENISVILTPVNDISEVYRSLDEYSICGKIIPIWEILGDAELSDKLKYINRL